MNKEKNQLKMPAWLTVAISQCAPKQPRSSSQETKCSTVTRCRRRQPQTAPTKPCSPRSRRRKQRGIPMFKVLPSRHQRELWRKMKMPSWLATRMGPRRREARQAPPRKWGWISWIRSRKIVQTPTTSSSERWLAPTCPKTSGQMGGHVDKKLADTFYDTKCFCCVCIGAWWNENAKIIEYASGRIAQKYFKEHTCLIGDYFSISKLLWPFWSLWSIFHFLSFMHTA